MKRPRLVDEFEQVYERWRRGEITQAQAAGLLGKSARTFRRYVRRYEASSLEGLEDRRAAGTGIRASRSEVAALVTLYVEHRASWSTAAFHREYRDRHGGKRSYSWVLRHLQAAGLVPRGTRGVPEGVRGERRKYHRVSKRSIP